MTYTHGQTRLRIRDIQRTDNGQTKAGVPDDLETHLSYPELLDDTNERHSL